MDANALTLFGLIAAWSTKGRNLVNNPEFETGNAGFTTDYVLWSGGCVGAGAYAVLNNPHIMSTNWCSFKDHTSGTGKMLILDGRSASDSILWRQIVPVGAGTTYVFSTWALKFGADNAPTAALYFAINGTRQSLDYVLPAVPGHSNQL
jgi:hypothetical protein